MGVGLGWDGVVVVRTGLLTWIRHGTPSRPGVYLACPNLALFQSIFWRKGRRSILGMVSNGWLARYVSCCW